MPALVFPYMMFSGSLNSTYPVSPFLPMGEHTITTMDILSSHSMVYLLIIMAIVLTINSKKFLDSLCELTIFNCLYLIFLFFYRWNQPFSGLMLNLSMDATMIAIMYPFIIRRYQHKIVLILPLIAILICKSSIGYGALLITILMLYRRKIMLLLLPLIYFIQPSELFNDNYRFNNWKRSMAWFSDHVNQYMGTGIGTYWSLGPYIQKLNKDFGSGFSFMHSDWLQVYFEMGLIGLVLVLCLYGSMLYKSYRKNQYLFTSVLIFGAVSVFNMPTRYIITAVIGMVLVKLCYEKDGVCHN